MFFVARFLLLWSLTLPFDIRDATIDKQAGLQTIFLGLGKQKYVIFVSSVLLISLALHTKLFYNYFIVFVIIHCSILLLNFYAKEKNHELYFTGLLDGILVFEFLVLVIEKYLV
jgi:4-hydroxybenzoate polyprenyltransferase